MRCPPFLPSPPPRVAASACGVPVSTRSATPGRSPCADLGAAYGTAKSGVGVSSMGVMKPDLIMKSIIPVVMAGVLGIYGLIIAVIIANQGAFPSPDPSLEARLPPSPLPPSHSAADTERLWRAVAAQLLCP